jgi:hypothetical protein
MKETAFEWGSCPPGELSRLAATLSFHRRVKRAVIAAALLAGATGVVGAGWLAHAALRPDPPAPGCVPCEEAPEACGGQSAQP